MKYLPNILIFGVLSFFLTITLIDSGVYEKLVLNVYQAQDKVESSLVALAFAVPRDTGPFQVVPVFPNK